MKTARPTCFSIFTGCGGADLGMSIAGYQSLGGIEWHKPAAMLANANLFHTSAVSVCDILLIDKIPTVDLLWISPPCPSFSIANSNRGETEKDLILARHLAKLIRQSKPRAIALENVRGYANPKYQSLGIIKEAMRAIGHTVEQSIECAANYGVPQSRERLIVRSSASPMSPLSRTHCRPSDQLPLLPMPNWISWWQAIQPFASTLPKSNLTGNQLKVLAESNSFPAKHLLIDGKGNRNQSTYTIREVEMPCLTITASIDKHPIRILIERCGYRDDPKIYQYDRPAPTIRSHTHYDDHGCYRVALDVMDSHDVYSADVRALAAWQGFPIDFDWGGSRAEAAKAIGNAVPPPLAKAVALSFSNTSIG